MPGQRSRLKPAMLVEFAKMCDGLLDDAAANAHAAHQTPIAMNLPVLTQRRVAQIHAPNQIRLVVPGKYPRLALHAQMRLLSPSTH